MLIEREQFHSCCIILDDLIPGSYTQTIISSSRNVSQDMTWDVKLTNATWESSTSLGHDYFVSPSLKIHETHLDGAVIQQFYDDFWYLINGRYRYTI